MQLVPVREPGWEQRSSRGRNEHLSARPRKAGIAASVYSPTPHKELHRQTRLRAPRPHPPRLYKSAVSRRERTPRRQLRPPAIPSATMPRRRARPTGVRRSSRAPPCRQPQGCRTPRAGDAHPPACNRLAPGSGRDLIHGIRNLCHHHSGCSCHCDVSPGAAGGVVLFVSRVAN